MLWFADYETRSKINLLQCGALLYANDPSTEILMAAVAYGNEPPRIQSCLGLTYDPIVSWGRFDYLIYRALEDPEYQSSQWIDAMALARYTGMPAGLDAFASALGFGEKKDPRGKRLIKMYCTPQPDGTFRTLEGDDLKAMQDYAKQDVALLQKAWSMLGTLLPEWEQYVRPGYEAIERMNENGVPIDVPAAERALALCEEHEAKLVEECFELCGLKPSQNLKIADFLGTRTCTREELENVTFTDPVKERVREIRLASAKAATKKLKPMIQMASSTGRAYGCFIPNGAHTGRGSSRDIQFQNMKRAVVDPEVFRKLHAGEGLHSPLTDVQENIRGFIRPKPPNKLVAVDYSQVEARVAAWLSGCKPMLDSFKDPARDIYKEAMARKLGCSPAEITKDQRDYGKILILGPTYGAGGGALCKQAGNMGVAMTPEQGREAQEFYKAMFLEVPQLWDALDQAAMDVVGYRTNSQVEVADGKLSFRLNSSGSTLELILPSGRKMRFLFPEIGEDRFGNPAVSVLTKHGRRTIWGGHWLENACQAIATDLKLDAMEHLTYQNLKLVLEVHDEIVVESPYPNVALNQMLDVMQDPPSWMEPGLIKAEGSILERYSK